MNSSWKSLLGDKRSKTSYFQCTYFADCVDWDQKLQQTMVEMFPLKSADAAYSKISGMLSTLGDPFTRIISPMVCME